MKVYHRLANDFAAEGVTAVFGLMGDGNMHWMEAMHDLGAEIYNARHEGAALSMADGWSRVAKDRGLDVPGVCTATHGPGVAQLATNMLVAARARTPMVVFVGESPEGDDEFAQRLDQSRFAEAIEAAYVKLTSPDHADEAVRKAFYLAKTESRPVLLSAPVSTQLATFEEFDSYLPSDQVIRREPIYPDPGAIQRAAEIVMSSSRPVIVVGRGAMWSGAGLAIRALARRCGAIIATSLLAKGWLYEDDFHVGISGLYATKTAIQLFEDADCVLAFGASMNKYTTGHGYLFPKARYIRFDDNPHAPLDGRRPSDEHIRADAALAAAALEEALADQEFKQNGYRMPDVKQRLSRAFEDPASFEIEPGTLDPRTICTTLDSLLPPEVGLLLGNGHQIGFGTMLFSRPRSLVVSNQHFGCVGPALSTSVGAVIAAGRQPSLLIEGDAGLMMFMGELDTAVRYDLPLLIVVMNDGALGAEYHKMSASGMDRNLALVPTPDFGAVARGFGARGTKVNSIDELAAATNEFLRKPGPMVIDAPISRNVLSIPYRRLQHGIDV